MAEARNMNQPHRKDDSRKAQLLQKWNQLLEGIPSRTPQEKYNRSCLAQIMEAQSQYLQGMTEETRTSNVGGFTKYIFPLLRQTYPALIAPNIVSVQPVDAPISAVFYYDMVYQTNKGSTVAGDKFPQKFNRNYAGEFIDGELAANGDGTNYGSGGTALTYTVGFLPVRPFNTNRGWSVVVRQINNLTGATVQSAVDNGSGGFSGDVSAGAINYTTGQITGFRFTSVPSSGHQIKVFYYYDTEYNSNLGKMGLNITQVPLEVQSRKLTANWSAEAAEDMRAFHGEDVESALVSGMAKEIAMEIDRDIITDLFAASTGTQGFFDRTPPPGITETDHLRSMITQISTVSNIIHKKTVRSPANFVVTSPLISALLTQLTTHQDFKPLFSNDMSATSPTEAPAILTNPGDFGIYRTGTLSNKWTVFEDPFFDDDKMLIGLNGRDYLNAGYVWAPYVMLTMTQSFQDPNDFTIRKGLRTRYGKKLLRPEFYGRLTVSNM